MKCPICRSDDTKVIDSRESREGNEVRRRRRCNRCGHRFSTREIVEKRLLMVQKRSGTTEAFDRDKIIRGLRTACRKRPVTLECIEETATGIERELLLRGESGPVQSHEIGRMILDKLLTVDHVAYVRFASVYRQFQSIEEFRAELERLSPQVSSKARPVGDANASPGRVPWGQLGRTRQPAAAKPEGAGE